MLRSRSAKVEIMRKLLLGFFGALLGLASLAAAPSPAEAQGFSVTIGTPGYYGPRPVYRSYPRYRPVYVRPAPVYVRPRPVYVRQNYYRPAYYGESRCTVRMHRYWDGYGWVRERRRQCW